MIHEIAYGRQAKPQILAKCGEAVMREEAVAFRSQGVDCPGCLTPGAWPSNGQQRAADFTAPSGAVFDNLVR